MKSYFVFVCVFIIASCCSNKKETNDVAELDYIYEGVEIKNECIPDDLRPHPIEYIDSPEIASKITYAIIHEVMGEELANHKPYMIELINDKYWSIHGNMPDKATDNSFVCLLGKDGTVYRIWREKTKNNNETTSDYIYKGEKKLNLSEKDLVPIKLIDSPEMASKIAYAIICEIYGEESARKKPYIIKLIDGKQWFLRGSLPKSSYPDKVVVGGTFALLIDKYGTVYRIWHDK